MPYAAPRPCPKHPKELVKKDKPCPLCLTHGWRPDKERGDRHKRGYGASWTKTRIRILKRDSYLCQPCLSNDRYAPGTQVDHIIPKAKGGSNDDDNLQAICNECHKTKTANER
ncbi:MAG: HNH endonuclease signature motif containing protein [Desulfobacterales bacterium]